jgi:hypothetical protein
MPPELQIMGNTVEVKFELQALKVWIKGEREDIPLITQNVGNQVAGFLQPMANIAASRELAQTPPREMAAAVPSPPRRKKAARTASGNASPHKDEAPIAVDIDHATWGTPQQSWNGVDKAMWLLHAVAKSGGPSELTTTSLVNLFNVRYRETKALRTQNVGRDLGRLEKGSAALVGRNQANNAWYLTELGQKHMLKLIASARERSNIDES